MLTRIKRLNIPNHGKLSRLKRTIHSEGSNIFRTRFATCGRLIIDTFLSAREFVRETDYNLTHLSKSLLSEKRDEFDSQSTHLFYQDSQLLMKLLNHTT